MSNSPVLDDRKAMSALDPQDMMGLTTGFPAQCRKAAEIAAAFEPPLTQRTVRNVVVTGLGGSAIGGDLLRCIAEETSVAPLVVNRDYHLPGFVGQETLVICASYSGGTEETLSAYRQARARCAQIVCITSGGALGEMAKADHVPVISIPGGQPPRASTGYLFFPMLAVLAKRGLLDRSVDVDVEETLALLDRLGGEYGPGTPSAENPAKQLADKLHLRIPVFYGSQGWRGAVANRWKCQFNENAKIHAFANVLPEQNHNEILAWTQCRSQARRWSVVMLRDPDEKRDAPRIAKRVEVTKSIIGRAAQTHEAWAQGETTLARMFSLVYLGDFVSVYAALLLGTNPTTIAGIDRLKAELAKLKS